MSSSNGSLVEKQPETAKASSKILGSFRGPFSRSNVDIEHVEDGDVSLVDDRKVEKKKKKKTQSLRRHCARFWCCYLFWSVIFLAIFLPIFFLVIIPAIAQLVVNKSTLLLVNATIIEPRAESIILTLEAALDLPIALPVRIDPLILEVYNKEASGNNTIFKSLIDGATIDGNTTLGVKSRYTSLNAPMWTDYVHQVVFEPHAPLPVRGSTIAYLGILKNHVTIDKQIHQNTLNSFAGFSIEDPQLLLPAREDGVNLIANVTLPNPSAMTLQIGTTVLDLKCGNYVLGNATIDNLMLYPGNHSSPINGLLDLPYLIENIEGIMKNQGDSLSKGFLKLEAVGRSVTFDGEEVPYYADAMRALTLVAEVPFGSLVINTIHGVIAPNGTNILQNLTDPNGPTNIHDIINSIDDPDGSLGLNKTRS